MPLVQDIPLARALHGSCELGQEVPAELFTAVARVLAFVMHLGARGVKGGFHRPGFEPPKTEGLPVADDDGAVAAPTPPRSDEICLLAPIGAQKSPRAALVGGTASAGCR